MRGRLVATACGLVLTAALGVPAAAQAAASRPGPAGAGTTAARPRASLLCAKLYDVGNGHYAGWTDSTHEFIGFHVDLAHAIPYCNVNRGNGHFFIEEEINGQLSGFCLSAKLGGMDEFSCDDGYSQWFGTKAGTYQGQQAWLLNDPYSLDCLYDDNQTSAIEDPCLPADTFEHFVWNALP